MKYNIEEGNLFDLDNDKYVYAHCISLDCAMGKGIAVEFNKLYPGMKDFMIGLIDTYNYNYPKVIPIVQNKKIKVFNLITKNRYYNKPRLEHLVQCLVYMKTFCVNHNIKYLAIPKLGAGLDKLNWDEVEKYIKQIFNDVDIEIEVRYLNNKPISRGFTNPIIMEVV